MNAAGLTFLAATFATVVAACIAATPRGYPLYPTGGSITDPSQVSRLVGYVRYVDGDDVSDHGASFELLPGCHFVETPTKWGSLGDNGGVVATTGKATFALPMKGGYQYAVVVEVESTAGPTGAVRVRAYEHDPGGAVTRTFTPVSSQEEIRRCRALEAESTPAARSAPAEVDTEPSAGEAPDAATPRSSDLPGPPCATAGDDAGATLGAPRDTHARGMHAGAVAAWARYSVFAHGGPFCAVDRDTVLGCVSSRDACAGRCEPTCAIYCFVSRDKATEDPAVGCFSTMGACERNWDRLSNVGRVGQYDCEQVDVPQ